MRRNFRSTPINYVPYNQILPRYYLQDGTIYFRKQDESKLSWAKGFNAEWADKPVPLKMLNGYPHISMRHPKDRSERILVRASHVAFTLIHRSKPTKGTKIRLKNGTKTDFREDNMEVLAGGFDSYPNKVTYPTIR